MKVLLKIFFASLLVLFLSVFSVVLLIRSNENFNGITIGDDIQIFSGIGGINGGIFNIEDMAKSEFIFNVENLDKLFLDGESNNISIQESTDKNLRIEVYKSNEKDSIELKLEETSTDGEGKVFLTRGESTKTIYKIYIPENLKEINSLVDNAHYEIENAATSFNAESRNAYFEIENLKGDLNLDVQNASFEIEDIDGNVNIDTINSKMEISKVRGNLYVNNSNGKAEIQGIDGICKVVLFNGKIEYEVEELKNDLILRTNNGKIEADLGESTDFEIEVSTLNGKIENDLGLDAVTYLSKSKLHGKKGNVNKKVFIETSNGKIEMY